VIVRLTDSSVKEPLQRYRSQAEAELASVLDWWMQYIPDDEDGFHGEIDRYNKLKADAPRGLVLYSRILWTFSAAYIHTRNREYLFMAERAYRYLIKHFQDTVNGGMYWSVDRHGQKLIDRKQVYGIAFCIYGMSEYYQATFNEQARDKAIELFLLLEQHSRDKKEGGYFEAFAANWQLVPDVRLSEKDANEKKTMNTHLHVLEAYTNLYRIWKNEVLAEALHSLLVVFKKRIIDTATHHQGLFFAENWELRSSVISYGHDIEASWLLYEASEMLGNPEVLHIYKDIVVKMAIAVLPAIDNDGGMWYESETRTGHWVKEKHWWPQAEAMVGFMNAYQLTGDKIYLKYSQRSWDFARQYICDKENGEWHWGVDEYGNMMEKEKAGFWKCPYHNGRACMEISKRISAILQ